MYSFSICGAIICQGLSDFWKINRLISKVKIEEAPEEKKILLSIISVLKRILVYEGAAPKELKPSNYTEPRQLMN